MQRPIKVVAADNVARLSTLVAEESPDTKGDTPEGGDTPVKGEEACHRWVLLSCTYCTLYFYNCQFSGNFGFSF